MKRTDEDFEMQHHDATPNARSESDLLAQARGLQGRHAWTMFGGALRRLRRVLARLAAEPAPSDARRLILH